MRTLNLPSVFCPYQGETRRPASPPLAPSPVRTISAEIRKSALLLNAAPVAPPSDDSVQVWRLANPPHPRWSSSIEMEDGKLLTTVKVENEQSLKTRSVMFAPLTCGVAAAAMTGTSITVRRARLMSVIRLIGAFLLPRGCET